MDDWESDLVPRQFTTVDEQRLSAFCTAANDGDIPKMKEMLEKKFVLSVNTQSPIKKETALHYACRGNQVEVIKFLIEQGADINMKDVRGKHAFHLSCSWGFLDAVKLLIQHDVKLDVVDKYNRSCLHWAAVNKHFDVVKELVNAGAPVIYKVSQKWQPIHEAVKGGSVEILKFLIDHGALSPSKDFAANKMSVTPLHVAAREGHLECLNLLLRHKYPVNAINQGQKTALHEAAFKGNKSCCHQLLLNGADPHAKDNTMRTPLLEASNQGHLHCAIFILDAGAKVNHSDQRGCTALHHLIQNQDIDSEKMASFVDMLLQYGANPNKKNADGENAVYLANLTHNIDVENVLQTASDKPLSLLHRAKICSRKLLSCNYSSINNFNIPTNLKVFVMQNSSYFSGW